MVQKTKELVKVFDDISDNFKTLANMFRSGNYEFIKTSRGTRSTADKNRLNPYIIFSNDIRKQVQAENPGAVSNDISKIMGQRWRELDSEKKAYYIAKSKEYMELYKESNKKAEEASISQSRKRPIEQDSSKKGKRQAVESCKQEMSSQVEHGSALLDAIRIAFNTTHEEDDDDSSSESDYQDF
ncbi:high mobility group box domain-containing protein [Chlamydoabsidia padenii]|nr:high mobility group box domain-containing protein [Chlamydoabsidia padenii]